MKDRFTRVLKGHIAIARIVFPKGHDGRADRPVRSQALWEAGLDFDHGTGHGIGSYLSVHEGPQRIAKIGHTPLEVGHDAVERARLLQDRRIRHPDREPDPGGAPLRSRRRTGDAGFETLTFTPIDLRLVEPSIMTGDEIAWLNAYHAQVREKLAGGLDPETQRWLEEATRPIG